MGPEVSQRPLNRALPRTLMPENDGLGRGRRTEQCLETNWETGAGLLGPEGWTLGSGRGKAALISFLVTLGSLALLLVLPERGGQAVARCDALRCGGWGGRGRRR